MTGAFEANLIRKLGARNLKKIEKTRIGVAGAGGLGSNCALNLVRVGFLKFTIADFDVIDPSNLDRQFYFRDQVGMKKVKALRANLLRVNPRLELRMIDRKIGRADVEPLFRDCEVVVECLDRAEMKSMLVSELLRLGKRVVAVSGLGGVGSTDELKTHRVKKNFVLIGDLQSDIQHRPAVAPRVSVAAAKQADAVLEFIIHHAVLVKGSRRK